MVKKALVIVLISIHLTGNTEIGQLLRMPQLLSHYFQHSRQVGHLSFFAFIAMHYGGDDGTSADNDYDNQLPCHNLQHNTISIAFSPMVKELTTSSFSVINKTEYQSDKICRICSTPVKPALQPPRV